MRFKKKIWISGRLSVKGFTVPGTEILMLRPFHCERAGGKGGTAAGSSLKRNRARRSMILMIMLNVQKHIWAVCLFVNETGRGISFTG